MPDTNSSPDKPFITMIPRRVWTIALFTSGTALLILSGWLYFGQVYSAPHRVFWDMISNQLAARSFTRTVTDSESSSSQVQELVLSPQVQARQIVTFSRPEADGSLTTVQTETISTPTADYARYRSIETTQKNDSGEVPDFSQLQKDWSLTEHTNAPGQSLQDAFLGLVPAGQLQPAERRRVIRRMQQQKVYEVDYAGRQQANEDGRRVYKYTVNIRTQQYAGLLRDVLNRAGLGQVDLLDPINYQTDATSQVIMVVDGLTHQLKRIEYPGQSRLEHFSGYGIKAELPLPTNTISNAEMMQRLESL